MRELSLGGAWQDRTSPSGESPIQGPLRMVRVGVLSAGSLLLAVVAHRLGGGSVPSLTGLCLLALVVTAAALGLTSVRLRLPLMVGAVGVGQMFLHAAVSALTTPMTGPLTVRGQHVWMTTDGGLAGSLTHATAMPAMHVSPRMSLFHAGATFLTAWLLARGEALLWRVVERAVPLRPGRPATPLARWQPLVPSDAETPTRDQRDVSVARGPPRLPATARHRTRWTFRPAVPCGPLPA